MVELPGDGPESLLDGLTGAQREAVLHTEGALLVLAAAGSGKTRVITRRIAYLIHCGIPPWNILALTFTNKAAAEMRQRALALLGGGEDRRSRGLLVTTFHSLCARLLREHAERIGLAPGFSIYDTDDQLAVCRRAVEACGLSATNFPARSVLAVISRAKNDLLDAEAFASRAREWNTRNIAAVYREYTRLMRDAGAVDFDDLLLLTARLLRENAEVRAACRDRWRYLLIDEYQDTNRAQFAIASEIAGAKDANICVVGDPDQSIYGWRGADLSNILEFEAHWPAARVIALGENFRSSAPILAAADALIRHNRRRRHKPLFTSAPGGERPVLSVCLDESDEAAVVVNYLKSRRAAGAAWNDMAVFYRTNSLSRVIEDACRGAAIPYVIARGTAFYEREEVRHALAYLRVLANPADDLALARVINVPARGIGAATVGALERFGAGAGVPLLEAARRAGEIPGLAPAGVRALGGFVAMVRAWEEQAGRESGTGGLTSLVDRVIRESGLREMYVRQARASGLDSDAQRVDNLDELVSSAHEFELEHDAAADPAAGGTTPALPRLRAYLESIALVSDADAIDPAQGAVTLMTFHAAKGLEFDSVAMIGLEEGILPHARAREEAEVEEERRLCFVGITRAKRSLLLTAAVHRTHRGQSVRAAPSRFLSEIPASLLRVDDRARGPAPEGAGDAGTRRDAATGATRGAGPAYRAGVRVRHPQFGVGEIVSVTPGRSPKAVVRFRDAGTKTLILEYARLTVIP
jgi:DNA helicase-2/ATP-dependent DNA helicase PcrA